MTTGEGDGAGPSAREGSAPLSSAWAWRSALLIGVAVVALSAALAVVTFRAVRRAAIDEKQALAEALNYTFELLLSQEALPSMQRMTENIATIKQVDKVVIVGRDMSVLASSDRLEVGKEVQSPLARAFLEGGSWQRRTFLAEDALIILQPLRGSRFTGGAQGDIVGAAEVTLSLDRIEGAARAAAIRILAISVGFYAVLAGALLALRRALAAASG